MIEKLKVKRWALLIMKVHCIGESLKRYIKQRELFRDIEGKWAWYRHKDLEIAWEKSAKL